jgi:hypothetical protein
MSDLTPESAAQWMVSRMEEDKRLYQVDAVLRELVLRPDTPLRYQADDRSPAVVSVPSIPASARALG